MKHIAKIINRCNNPIIQALKVYRDIRMIRLLFYHIAVIFVIILSAPCANATVHIHGKVYDSDNKPLEFVTVRVSGTPVGTTTDVKGQYSISVAERDTLIVKFTCIGYKEVERKLIDAKDDVTLNQMLQLNARELNEVEFAEYKRQLDGMQDVDAKAYRGAPDVSGGSIESLITTMAGVTGANELSSQYSVRGGSYDENGLYINGMEIYRPQLVTSGEQEGLSAINPDMVDRVQFSTGGFSAEYGDRMSSVLDITYRRPEHFEGSFTAGLMGGSLALGQSSGHFSQLHGLRYKRTTSVLGTLDTKGEYDPSFFDYQTNINLRLNRAWSVSVLGNVAINDYRFNPVNRITSFGTAEDAKQFTVYFDGGEKDRFSTLVGGIALHHTPDRNSDYTLLASGFRTDELVTYDIAGEYWLDQAGTSGSDGIGGELGVGRYQEHARNRIKASVVSLSFRGNNRRGSHSWSYGLSGSCQSVYERTREWELRDSAGYSLPSWGENLEMIYQLTSRQDEKSVRGAMFVQDAFRSTLSSGYLAVNAGIRMSYWNFNKELLVSPRVSVSFMPSAADSWVLRAAAGLYYQSPFYKEYRRIEGSTVVLNRDIKSPRSLQLLIGADYSFRMLNRPFKLTAEAYGKKLSRLIPYEVENLKVVYDGVNASSGYVAGVDMKLFGQFVPGSDSWISMSLMKSNERLNGVNVPRPNDRRYSFGLYFTDYFPGIPDLRINLRGVFSDGLPVTAPRTSRDKGYFRTPAYKRVDIGASYALLSPDKHRNTGIGRYLKAVWLGVDCFNLFDIANVSGYYWVTDVNDVRYAVPNYLTRRQINVHFTVDF